MLENAQTTISCCAHSLLAPCFPCRPGQKPASPGPVGLTSAAQDGSGPASRRCEGHGGLCALSLGKPVGEMLSPLPLSPSRVQPEWPPGATGGLPWATSSACLLQLFFFFIVFKFIFFHANFFFFFFSSPTFPSTSPSSGLPFCSVGKGSACIAGNPGSVLRSGRSAGEGTGYPLQYSWASLVAQLGKNLPAMRETWV